MPYCGAACGGSLPLLGLSCPLLSHKRHGFALHVSNSVTLVTVVPQGADGDTAADLLAETEALLKGLGKGAPPPPPSGYMSDDEVSMPCE